MAAPEFVPVPPALRPRLYRSPDHVPEAWLADRPADIAGRQPEGRGLGYQGPDQGYALVLAERFRNGAHASGLDTDASCTQIVPVILGAPEAALAMSARLREAGLWATSIRPPTVPAGTSRLRLAFTAAHQESDIDRLLEVLSTEDTPRRVRAL